MHYRYYAVFIAVLKKYIHSSCILWKDCSTVNTTVLLAATLVNSRVVVGGWMKSLVLSIQIRKPHEIGIYNNPKALTRKS